MTILRPNAAALMRRNA